MNYCITILIACSLIANQQARADSSSEDTQQTWKGHLSSWLQTATETTSNSYQKAQQEAGKLVDAMAEQTGKVVTPEKRKEMVEALSATSTKTYTCAEETLHTISSLWSDDEDCEGLQP